MARINISKYYYAVNFELLFTTVSQSIANNTSQVRVLGRLIGTGNGEYGTATTGTVTFNGTSYNFSATAYSFPNASSVNKVFFDETFTVAHGADGKKSVSGSMVWNHGSTAFKTASVSETVALATIPRYAKINTFSASINDLTATLSWTADKKISRFRVSSNGGSTWGSWITSGSTSGSTSLSVSPGSSYHFRVQIEADDSKLTTNSSTLARTATKTPSTLNIVYSSRTMGYTQPITIVRSYSAYTHRIIYRFGSASGYIAGSSSSMTNVLNHDWEIPYSLANQIPNATSGTLTLEVHTYYGTTYIGVTKRTFTINVPYSFVPTISSVTLTGIGLRGANYVKTKSSVRVQTSSTGSYSSTISKIEITYDGRTYTGTNITTATMQNNGTRTLTVKVTDSRGRTASTTRTITVENYWTPNITNLKVFRSNASGVADDNGAYGRINFNYSIASINNANTRRVMLRYKRTDTDTWTTVYDEDPSDYSKSMGFTVEALTDVPYDVQVYAYDYYASSYVQEKLSTVNTIMDIHSSGKGITFGGVALNEGYNFQSPASFSGGIEPVFIPTGSDINDYQTPGFYYNNLNVDVATMTNTPDRYAFSLIVYKDAGVTQVWNNYSQSNHLSYMRSYYNGTWSDWMKYSMYDSGSNSNGRYIRFSDGEQICWGSITVSTTTTLWGGNIYITPSSDISFTFPSSFASIPSCTFGYSPSNGVIAWGDLRSCRTTGGDAFLARPTQSQLSGTLYFMAVGRWK